MEGLNVLKEEGMTIREVEKVEDEGYGTVHLYC